MALARPPDDLVYVRCCAEHAELERPVHGDADEGPASPRVFGKAVFLREAEEGVPAWDTRRHVAWRHQVVETHALAARVIAEINQVFPPTDHIAVDVERRLVARHADVDVRADDAACRLQDFARHRLGDTTVAAGGIRVYVEGHVGRADFGEDPFEAEFALGALNRLLPQLELCSKIVQATRADAVFELACREFVAELRTNPKPREDFGRDRRDLSVAGEEALALHTDEERAVRAEVEASHECLHAVLHSIPFEGALRIHSHYFSPLHIRGEMKRVDPLKIDRAGSRTIVYSTTISSVICARERLRSTTIRSSCFATGGIRE